jgi:formylglycine-generating enzyme required for sulfatase activity
VQDLGTAQDAAIISDVGPAGDAGPLDANASDVGSLVQEVLIPVGRFTMGGAESGEVEREVQITRPFMMQVAELTQGEWQQFFNANPSGTQDDAHPVERVGDADIDLPSSRCGVLGYTTHPVRDRLPNLIGLYGTRGNVAEWVWDWFDSYRGQNVADPLGPSGLTLRVTRGGGWTFHARLCRVTHRAPRYPSCQTDSLGIRLVRTIP